MVGEDPSGAAPGTEGTAVSTRRQRRQAAAAGRRTGHRWRYALVGVAAVLGGVAVAVVLTVRHQSTARAAGTTTPVHPVPAPPLCPLRGTPAPGGVVPARPALAVKIGNYSGDRPSAGLNQADVVFEEPVEGAITRLVAVFQCQGAQLVGDIRSARQPDVGILSQLSDPIFVHAGGIAPVLSLLADAPLVDRDLLAGPYQSVIVFPSGRVAPYSTFVSTASAWGLDAADRTPPAPVFSYGAAPPAGFVPASGGSVHLPFSPSSDVTWQWNPSTSSYLRSYSGSPDVLAGGGQTSADNVVVMTVPTSTGSWLENEEGGHEVLVTSTGSGPLLVLRDGVAIAGTWSRSSESQPVKLTSSAGVPITLAPGNTWVELVPVGVPVTPVPVPAPAPVKPTAPSVGR